MRSPSGPYAGPGCGVDHHPESCLCDLHMSPADVEAWQPYVPLQHVKGAAEAIEHLDLSPPWTPAKLADVLEYVGKQHDALVVLNEVRAEGHDDAEALRLTTVRLGLVLQEQPIGWLRASYMELRSKPIPNRRELRTIISKLLRRGYDLDETADLLRAPLKEVVGHISSGQAASEAVIESYKKALHILRNERVETFVSVADRTGLGERSIPEFARFCGIELPHLKRRVFSNPPEVKARCQELRQQGLTYAEITERVKEEMGEKAKDLTRHSVEGFCRNDRDRQNALKREARKRRAEAKKARREAVNA